MTSFDILDDQDVAIELFKRMLPCTNTRSLTYHTFYEFFDKLAEVSYWIKDRQEQPNFIANSLKMNFEGTFQPISHSDSEYSLSKSQSNSPEGLYRVDFADILTGTAEARAEVEYTEPLNSKVHLTFGYGSSKPMPSHVSYKRTSLNIVDLTNKTLNWNLNPSNTVKNKILKSDKNVQKENKLAFGKKKSCLLRSNSKSKVHIVSKEVTSPPFKLRRKSQSKKLLVSPPSHSTRASSIKKDSPMISLPKVQDVEMVSRGMIELLEVLAEREALLDLCRIDLSQQRDFNICKLYDRYLGNGRSALKAEDFQKLLIDLEITDCQLEVIEAVNKLSKGQSELNFLHFSEMFFPLSHAYFSIMKQKLTTLAPNSKLDMSNETKKLLKCLMEHTLSLPTLKASYFTNSKVHADLNSIDNLHTMVKKAFDTGPGLSLHTDQVKKKVIDLLVDPKTRIVTPESVAEFLKA